MSAHVFFEGHAYLFSINFPEAVTTAFAVTQVETALTGRAAAVPEPAPSSRQIPATAAAPRARRRPPTRSTVATVTEEEEGEEAEVGFNDEDEDDASAPEEIQPDAERRSYFRDTTSATGWPGHDDDEEEEEPEEEERYVPAPALMLWHPHRGSVVETVDVELHHPTYGTYCWVLRRLRRLRQRTDRHIDFIVVCDDATTLVPRGFIVTRRATTWPSSAAGSWETQLTSIIGVMRRYRWLRVDPCLVRAYGQATWGAGASGSGGGGNTDADTSSSSSSSPPSSPDAPYCVARRTQVRLNDLGWRRRFRITDVQNRRLQQLRSQENRPVSMALRGLPLCAASGTYVRFLTFRDLVYHAPPGRFRSRIYIERPMLVDTTSPCVPVVPFRHSDAPLSGKKVLTLAMALLDDAEEHAERMREDSEYYVRAPTTTLVVTTTARLAAWEQTLQECLDETTYGRRVRILRTSRDLRRHALASLAPGGGVRIVVTTDRRLQGPVAAGPRHREFVARMNRVVMGDDDAADRSRAPPSVSDMSISLDDVGLWHIMWRRVVVDRLSWDERDWPRCLALWRSDDVPWFESRQHPAMSIPDRPWAPHFDPLLRMRRRAPLHHIVHRVIMPPACDDSIVGAMHRLSAARRLRWFYGSGVQEWDDLGAPRPIAVGLRRFQREEPPAGDDAADQRRTAQQEGGQAVESGDLCAICGVKRVRVVNICGHTWCFGCAYQTWLTRPLSVGFRCPFCRESLEPVKQRVLVCDVQTSGTTTPSPAMAELQEIMGNHADDRCLLVAQSNPVLRFISDRVPHIGVCSGSSRSRTSVARKFQQRNNNKVRHLALTVDTLKQMHVENVDRVILLHGNLPLFVIADHVCTPAPQLYVHTIRHV